jgi:hypothetical protein
MAVSKKNMKCNVTRPSTRPGKKRMVKACEGGKEKIIWKGKDNSLWSKRIRSQLFQSCKEIF